jgi:hypothetical protein
VRRGDLKILSVPDLRPTAIESFIIYNNSQPLSPNAREFLGVLRKSQHNSQSH